MFKKGLHAIDVIRIETVADFLNLPFKSDFPLITYCLSRAVVVKLSVLFRMLLYCFSQSLRDDIKRRTWLNKIVDFLQGFVLTRKPLDEFARIDLRC